MTAETKQQHTSWFVRVLESHRILSASWRAMEIGFWIGFRKFLVFLDYMFFLTIYKSSQIFYCVSNAFYAPGSNDRGHVVFVLSVWLFVCLSVCLSVVNFNLHDNFWIVRDRDFIFGIHTSLMTPFQYHQGQWLGDLDLEAENSFLDFVAAEGGGHSVSQTRLDFYLKKSIRALFIQLHAHNIATQRRRN